MGGSVVLLTDASTLLWAVLAACLHLTIKRPQNAGGACEAFDHGPPRGEQAHSDTLVSKS